MLKVTFYAKKFGILNKSTRVIEFHVYSMDMVGSSMNVLYLLISANSCLLSAMVFPLFPLSSIILQDKMGTAGIRMRQTVISIETHLPWLCHRHRDKLTLCISKV